MIGIYKITNPNGKVYIGQSINIEKRKRQYAQLQSCKNQKKLYASLVKHGFSTHSFEVIEECSVQELNTRERFWQDLYEVLDPKKGMNLKLTDTAQLKQVHSEETREKLSKANMGKTYTADTLQKMSEAKKGIKSPKKGIRTVPRSEEVKLKISKTLTGIERNPRTEAHTYNLSAALKGKKRSEATKQKMIESRTGKKRGPYKKREKIH